MGLRNSKSTKIVPYVTPFFQRRVREMALPPFPPLRTVRVDFSTYSSSLSLRPYERTRFLHV